VKSSDKEYPLKDLTLEITNYCILNCIHCSSESTRAASELGLPLKTIKTVINDFKKLGGRRIEISGGEPLCHKELPQIIRLAKQLGLETSLFSCGIFDPSQLEKGRDGLEEKAKELKRLGIDKVFVSLHGSNEEYHNQISQKSSFRLTTKFIRELVKQQVFVGVHFVPVHLNFDNIDDLIQYCSDLGVKEVGILRFVPQGRGKENEDVLRLSEEQTLELASLLSREIGKKSIVRVGSHLDFTFFFKKRRKPKSCTAGISKCLITSKGQVIPCAVFKGLDDFLAGNVKETRLENVWKKSGVFKKLREFNPIRMKGLCAKCKYLVPCRGRCPAQRYYEWKDLYMGPDPYCPKEALIWQATMSP